MATRVVLAIGFRLYREALHEATTAHCDLEIVAEADNGREVLHYAATHAPDLIILELGLKELNGVETMRQLRTEWPELPVVAISIYSDYPLVTRALRAGARAFVFANDGLDDLHRAIQACLEGHVFLSPGIEGAMVELMRAPDAPEVLTPREREVLQLLSEGKSTRRVAETLSVSTKTVETHRMHIMEKLRVHSIAELTKYAIREGITTL